MLATAIIKNIYRLKSALGTDCCDTDLIFVHLTLCSDDVRASEVIDMVFMHAFLNSTLI